MNLLAVSCSGDSSQISEEVSSSILDGGTGVWVPGGCEVWITGTPEQGAEQQLVHLLLLWIKVGGSWELSKAYLGQVVTGTQVGLQGVGSVFRPHLQLRDRHPGWSDSPRQEQRLASGQHLGLPHSPPQWESRPSLAGGPDSEVS